MGIVFVVAHVDVTEGGLTRGIAFGPLLDLWVGLYCFGKITRSITWITPFDESTSATATVAIRNQTSESFRKHFCANDVAGQDLHQTASQQG